MYDVILVVYQIIEVKQNKHDTCIQWLQIILNKKDFDHKIVVEKFELCLFAPTNQYLIGVPKAFTKRMCYKRWVPV